MAWLKYICYRCSGVDFFFWNEHRGGLSGWFYVGIEISRCYGVTKSCRRREQYSKGSLNAAAELELPYNKQRRPRAIL